MGHWTYLLIILLPGIPGLLITWFLGRVVLAPKWKTILVTVVLMTFYLVAIDLWAIRTLHVWSFKPEMLTGIQILGDDIEEWVLFIVTQTLIVSWALMLSKPKTVLTTLKEG